MSRNSFLLKAWAVTVDAALVGLSKADENRGIALVACGVGAVFALLDSMYLATERTPPARCCLVVADQKPVWWGSRPEVTFGGFVVALFSWSVLPLYLAAGAVAGLIAASV